MLFPTFLRFILFNCPSLSSSSLAGLNSHLLFVLAHIPVVHNLGHVSPASVDAVLIWGHLLLIVLGESCFLGVIHIEVLLVGLTTSQICLFVVNILKCSNRITHA